MRKRMIAFYNVLIFAIVCGPLIASAAILMFELISNGTSE